MLNEIKEVIKFVNNGSKSITVGGHSAQVISDIETKFTHSYTVVCSVKKDSFGGIHVEYNDGGIHNDDMKATIDSYKEIFGE
jgi:hypothetical protein